MANLEKISENHKKKHFWKSMTIVHFILIIMDFEQKCSKIYHMQKLQAMHCWVSEVIFEYKFFLCVQNKRYEARNAAVEDIANEQVNIQWQLHECLSFHSDLYGGCTRMFIEQCTIECIIQTVIWRHISQSTVSKQHKPLWLQHISIYNVNVWDLTRIFL